MKAVNIHWILLLCSGNYYQLFVLTFSPTSYETGNVISIKAEEISVGGSVYLLTTARKTHQNVCLTCTVTIFEAFHHSSVVFLCLSYVP